IASEDAIRVGELSPHEQSDSRRHPHPNPPPQAGEGAHCRCGPPQSTGLKLSVENSACMICSFWFEKRTPGPKLIGAMTPVSRFLVFSSSAMVQAQLTSLPQRPIAANSVL